MVFTLILENYDYASPSVSDLAGWASNFGLTHPVLADPGTAVGYSYIGTTGVTSIGLPSTQLLGPGMEVLAVNQYSISRSMIEAHLPD